MYPMLAAKGNFKNINGNDYLCQPKLNGIRALWNPESMTLLTRNGNKINSVDHIVDQLKKSNLKHLPLDGELFTTRVSFQKLNGLARRQRSGDETLILEFHIFDIAIKNMVCENRLSLLHDLAVTTHIKRVPTIDPGGKQQIQSLYKKYLNKGFEGIVLRKKEEMYFPGRTNDLLKIKPVLDMEAKLVGFAHANDDDSKNHNTFGSLILKLSNGLIFRCSGLTNRDRWRLWAKKPIGADVTFKYDALSDNGIPLFPRYSHIRWDVRKVAA